MLSDRVIVVTVLRSTHISAQLFTLFAPGDPTFCSKKVKNSLPQLVGDVRWVASHRVIFVPLLRFRRNLSHKKVDKQFGCFWSACMSLLWGVAHLEWPNVRKANLISQERDGKTTRRVFFCCKKWHVLFANPFAGSQLVATRSVNPTTAARVTRISFFPVFVCPLLPSRNQKNSANFLHSNRASPDRSCFRKTTNILSGAGSKLLKKNSILWSLSRGIRKPAPKCLPEKEGN